MENMLAVTWQIIMLLIIALSGFMLRRIKVLTDPVIKGVNKIIMYVGWPAMMLMVTQKDSDPEYLKIFLIVLLITTLLFAVLSIVMFLFSKNIMKTKYAPVAAMLATMPNAGFMGLPIIQAVYGDTGALLLAAVIISFNLVMWTINTTCFEGFSVSSLKGLLNPGFIFAVLGGILFLLQVTLPVPIRSASNQLGGLCTPLSMLLIGARMDGLRPASFKNIHLWLPAGFKLILMPLLALAVCRIAGLNEIATGVIVITAGMPAAAGCQMLAEKYDIEVGYASLGVCLSTILCMATIPLLMLVL